MYALLVLRFSHRALVGLLRTYVSYGLSFGAKRASSSWEFSKRLITIDPMGPPAPVQWNESFRGAEMDPSTRPSFTFRNPAPRWRKTLMQTFPTLAGQYRACHTRPRARCGPNLLDLAANGIIDVPSGYEVFSLAIPTISGYRDRRKGGLGLQKPRFKENSNTAGLGITLGARGLQVACFRFLYGFAFSRFLKVFLCMFSLRLFFTWRTYFIFQANLPNSQNSRKSG
jgi:hypothetical protein